MSQKQAGQPAKGLSRRTILKTTLGTLGLAASTKVMAGDPLVCLRTPSQTSGPFYPGEALLNSDTDLTYVEGRAGRAAGQVVYIQGVVRNAECQPVEGALVELWQAAASGRYNHRADPNPAPLDPNFQYWGKAVTDAEGKYMFKTVIPGAYPATDTWMRPPHLHFRVVKRGHHELVTQMYFAGDPLNEADQILGALSPAERALVIVPFAPAPEGLDRGAQLGNFDLTLRRV